MKKKRKQVNKFENLLRTKNIEKIKNLKTFFSITEILNSNKHLISNF